MQVVAPKVYGTPSRQHSLARDKEEKQHTEARLIFRSCRSSSRFLRVRWRDRISSWSNLAS